MREVWRATVRGERGRFEWATLSVDDFGGFVLATGSVDGSAQDRAVIEHDDMVALFEVLDVELGPDNG
jgi:hypothetical protein